MKLLYADLPERGEPKKERGRVELLVAGVVAAAGVGLAGTGLVGDLLRNRPRRERQSAFAVVPGAAADGFVGVERAVGAPTVNLASVGDLPEIEVAPPSPEDDALSVIDNRDADPLPDTGTAPVIIGNDPPGGAGGSTPSPTTTTVPPSTTTEAPAIAPTTTTIAAVSSTTVPDAVPTTTSIGSAPPSSSTTVAPTTTTTLSPGDPSSPYSLLAAAAGFALTPAMVDVIAEEGVEAWVDGQVNPETVPDPVVDEVLSEFDLLDTSFDDLVGGGVGGRALSQARWAAVVRSVVGERQVAEQMIGLWREHFSLAGSDAATADLDRRIRDLALEDYVSLLEAVIDSPAMYESHGLTPGTPVTADDLVDSSFARTVLERFTFGSADRYAEQQVTDTAAALAGGVDARLAHLRSLVEQVVVSRHIGSLIADTLLGDRSTDAARESVIEEFQRGGQVRSGARRALLLGGAGADPGGTRSGLGWLVAAARALGTSISIGGRWDPTDAGSIAGMLRTLGADPGSGLADVDWESAESVGARWEVARRLAGGSGEVATDLAPFWPEPGIPAREAIDGMATAAGAFLVDHEREAMLIYLGLEGDELVPALEDSQTADLIALMVGMPSFMRRDGGAS